MTALKQFVDVLEKTQWMPAEGLAAYQRKPLGKLLRHAYETVPFYRDRLAVLFRMDGSIDWDRWSEVPFLTRSDIQNTPEELTSNKIPAKHGDLHSAQTSGSTGRPTETKHTMFSQLAKSAVVERLIDWHGIDRDLKLASIRRKRPGVAEYPKGEHELVWSIHTDYLDCHGPHALLNANTPVHQQAEWLSREQPDYLLTRPSNVAALVDFIANDVYFQPGFRLASILTLGEIVSDELRTMCRDVFGVEIVDNYSATECGVLALQCPEATQYHLQSEVALVEVLNSNSHVCGPGELGRIVVTPFYNLAMPLIRYELGDYATPGGQCSCGRRLPVLSRVQGRSRNFFRFPGGTMIAPEFKAVPFLKYLRARQWQVAQTGPLEIEVRLVPRVSDEMMDFDGMTRYIQDLLRADIKVKYKLLNKIPLNPGGKHEDYVCEIAQEIMRRT